MLWQNLLKHNISPIQKDVKDDEEEPDQYVYRLQIPPQMLQIVKILIQSKERNLFLQFYHYCLQIPTKLVSIL